MFAIAMTNLVSHDGLDAFRRQLVKKPLGKHHIPVARDDADDTSG